MKPLDRLVWVDLETTGLDPCNDVILEIAIVITDGAMREIAFWSQVVGDMKWNHRSDADPFVREMHDKNGLWLACDASTFSLERVEQSCIHFLDAYAPNYDGPICGASPHFDKSFLDSDMPHLARRFSHRVFDVSTLKQLECNVIGLATETETTHRALPDIRGSIAEARAFYQIARAR